MKKARGQVRKLLLAIGDIQDEVSKAQAAHNDDSAMARDRLTRALNRAFKICINITSEYDQVERRKGDPVFTKEQ